MSSRPPEHDEQGEKPEGTILLVDDEASLRRLLARALRKDGFQVREAACGEDALEILEEDSSNIRLLVTDIIMPGMGGYELVERGASLRPELPVLLISGYAGELVRGGAAFLQKPFTMRQFMQEVHRILEILPAPEAKPGVGFG